nr:MAG TPA: hypothetical protein [Caudoviricetes sp.]
MSFPVLSCFKLSLYIIVAMPLVKHLKIGCFVMSFRFVFSSVIF